jgi:hypothetical protein
MKANPIRITAPVASRTERTHRISADVDGRTVWFESDEAPLAPLPEAFASAFVIPAMRVRRPLAIEGSVDPKYGTHMEALGPRLKRAWRYAIQPHRYTRRSRVPAAVARPAARTGLFFTGGVDSFHALLHSAEQIRVLINVHGFDVALADEARQRAVEDAIRAIGKQRGVEVAFMRTNLREHPLVSETPWERAHGGALAAAAHALNGRIDKICIASSQPQWSRNPWGSHWSIDPLWSSATLAFVHLDAEKDRRGKIHAIAHDPTVQRHLRVCWSQTGEPANCSRCEKCMHTMLVLEECGVLDRHVQFDGTDLLDLVRSLPRSKWRHRILEALSRSPDIDPELRSAVAALYRRSVILKSPAGTVWRALGRLRYSLLSPLRPKRPGRPSSP